MELKPGLSALVTGGASGIGKALSLALGKNGVFVTIVDLFEDRGEEVALLVEKQNKAFHPDRNEPSSLFIKCDVTSRKWMAAAFDKHLETFGGLDICINSAGISSHVPFQKDKTDGKDSWRRVIDVNFLAVVDSTHLAIQAMRSQKKTGVIINLASSAGLYPMQIDPIYSGSKGGVVMFTRSLASLKSEGIRINTLCPEFVHTEMGSKVNSKLVSLLGGYIPMEMVVNGAFELIRDSSKAGSCLWVTNRRGLEYWPSDAETKKFKVKSLNSKGRYSYKLPSKIEKPDAFDKIVVHTFDHNFRRATKIVRERLRSPIKSDHILVKILYAGVNASDVNFSSGRYFKDKNPPLDAGFEGVGVVVEVGDLVDHLRVGAPVALMLFGCYAEFMMVPSKHVMPVPRPDPEVLAMLTSGLTASIALETAGKMVSGEIVLVTAAAGGTGQFAVQLAKLAGNKVVATCGGEKKAALLKSLGVDRVIDYRKEDIKSALRKEFPEGVNIIYESVGGDMFHTCVNALAIYGRLIVIGMVSQYQGEHGWKPLNYSGLCEKILAKSQTVAGFFLLHYAKLWKEHLDRLFDLYSSGKLKVAVDPKKFLGISSVADAVEYLHSGESLGKVVVCIDPSFTQPSAKL
ncbi:ARP protein (REF) isoform X2 [Wolffia australiana]